MKFSSKILKCQLSPVRKFNPCADQAVAAGRTIYHLNIGQPDVKTPESFYQAVREFREPTLEYAPASGLYRRCAGILRQTGREAGAGGHSGHLRRR